MEPLAAERTQGSFVEVVYVTAAEERSVQLPFEPGMTAGAAAARSGLLEHCGAEAPLLGVFGRTVTAAQPLAPGDRVEICRPLPADPRSRRRAAAACGGVMIAPKRPR